MRGPILGVERVYSFARAAVAPFLRGVRYSSAGKTSLDHSTRETTPSGIWILAGFASGARSGRARAPHRDCDLVRVDSIEELHLDLPRASTPIVRNFLFHSLGNRGDESGYIPFEKASSAPECPRNVSETDVRRFLYS
jgi:hypothetical protein